MNPDNPVPEPEQATAPVAPLRPPPPGPPPGPLGPQGQQAPIAQQGSHAQQGPYAQQAPPAPPAGPSRANVAGLLIAVAVGTLVSVALGVYGSLQTPTGYGVSLVGFPGGQAAKAALATGAFVLAIVQLVSAMVMYGRFPGIAAPSWIGGLHRWSGRIAVLLTVPVAVHCLYAFGFEYYEPRVLVHSLFGCFFYGAFVVKMLVLNGKGMPKLALPVIGGAVFTALTALWLTSALYVFSIG